MASVTYDGRSFMLDGRRILLVSGSIAYARVPRASWADRIHAAKLAGLNTIDVPVFWHRHEPRAGQFDFKGENDLRHFIELIGRAGLMCVLRTGPYVGQNLDMGGLPPWLAAIPNVRLRTNSGPYLEACSRFLSAVAEEVRDLQITAPGVGGPIVLVQNEAHWTCGDDDLAHAYLGELIRYLREGGINVPIINANNLWQGVEGEIDGWCGSEQMMSTLRQLATVRPDQPRMVIDFNIGASRTWGAEPKPPAEPLVVQRRLAEVLATCGQFNLQPFFGGTNFGFTSGREHENAQGYTCTSQDHDAPLDEAGRATPLYNAVRRVCHFASHFGRVLSNLDMSYQPVMLDVTQHVGSRATRTGGKNEASQAGYVIAHAQGGQGGIAFVFRDQHAKGQSSATLLLPDGSNLTVPLGEQHVAWCLLDVHVGGRARIDACAFCAFATVGKVFVCFGPAGAKGVVSVNGAPIEMEVPKGKKPVVLEHEGLYVVLCNEEQIDSTFISESGVYIGAAGLNSSGEPVADEASEPRHITHIDPSGTQKQISAKSRNAAKAASPKATLQPMLGSDATDYITGDSARFATVAGPSDLVSLGCPSGYGWYRLSLKSGAAKKLRITTPHAADRLHFYLDGELAGIVGEGPGASDHTTISLKKGNHHLVVLADNLGRASGGVVLGEPKGLYGPIQVVSPVKGLKSKIVSAEPLELLKFKTPLWEVRPGDSTAPDRLTFVFMHRKSTPIVVRVANTRARGLLIVNGTPVAYLERGAVSTTLLEQPALTKGNNTIQVAIMNDGLTDTVEHALKEIKVTIEECVENLTAKAEWAFAKWEQPAGSGYRSKPGTTKGPVWWRGSFTASSAEVPLWLDLSGMTKGQIYIDDRHLGRYFVAAPGINTVGPQSRYLIPSAWIRPGEAHELVLFDEHGGNPTKAKLAYDTAGTVIRS